MPGHIKKSDGPDPDPAKWLFVSYELKEKNKVRETCLGRFYAENFRIYDFLICIHFFLSLFSLKFSFSHIKKKIQKNKVRDTFLYRFIIRFII